MPQRAAVFVCCCRSNNHIVGWSGAYNVPEGKVLWGILKDIQFKPRGPAFCPKLDNDLEPMT